MLKKKYTTSFEITVLENTILSFLKSKIFFWDTLYMNLLRIISIFNPILSEVKKLQEANLCSY